MNLLRIIDLGDGRAQVSWQRGNSVPRSCPPLPLNDPRTVEDRTELRWYLEEFLGFPYGAERWRAQQLEDKMQHWGESLFQQVFAELTTNPDPRELYEEAVREGIDQCELCLVPVTSEFLNIPWELLRDPTPGRGYLAPSLGGLYRQRTGHKIEVPVELSGEQVFRILLVICRPHGVRDIPVGTIARPVLEVLRPLRRRIALELLRPPTFDQLRNRLCYDPGRYQLVHFDGHGVFANERGHLVFEKDNGTEHFVDSEKLAQALSISRTPLFVLNACQSAEEGRMDPFRSVAAQLVAVGAKAVVAMSYSIYATAATLFMRRFYDALVEHKPLSAAVSAGRRNLYSNAERQSVVGPIPLTDWIVPTLYQQEQEFVVITKDFGERAEEVGDPGAVYQQAMKACPEGRFGFIGRDYDILRIERALRWDESPWLLLTGMGGSGKTELARGFARWYAETGGCAGGVFATSFKERADFAQVIGSIAGFGTDLSRMPEEEQRARLLKFLMETPCLLVWDNLEPVAGYPEGEPPLATDEERAKLSQFLKALRGGKSRVILTTRKPGENWLGVAYKLIELGGLSDRDVVELATEILRTVGRKPEEFKDDPEYSRLLKLLSGHPRSMEVVLPQLRNKTPSEIIEALQHRTGVLGEALEDASIGYAFSRLSDRARTHLPLLALFGSQVDANTLRLLAGGPEQQQRIYRELIGDALTATEWETLLDEAARAGLLRPLGQRVYELHPTLPLSLRRQLLARVGDRGAKQLDRQFMKFYAAFALQLSDEISKASRDAAAVCAIEEANLLRALRLTERNEQWGHCLAIVQTIVEFYRICGRLSEGRALRTRLLQLVGEERPAQGFRAELWSYLWVMEGRDAFERKDFDSAESAGHSVLDHLLAVKDPEREPNVALIYHHFGRIAEERQQFGEAEQWFRKALEIYERLELEQGVVDEYHHLGNIAYLQHQLDDAEQWYNKALAIWQHLGLERGAANGYHQLGRITEDRQRFDEAKRWYARALEIRQRLGLQFDAASDYHQLGNVALQENQLDEGEHWYRKALEIYERLGPQGQAAPAYHQLGMIAEKRQRFDEAEQWYRRALVIWQRLGPEQGVADEYHHLGTAAFFRRRFDEAEEWWHMALDIYRRLDLKRDAAVDYDMLSRIAEERQRFDEAEQWSRRALETFLRLGLERDVTLEYHRLGMLAERRSHFDEAEQWYRKALEIEERAGEAPMIVYTVALIGVCRREQGDFWQAVSWLGRALTMASGRTGRNILVDLAPVLRAMGESEFTDAWRQTFKGEDPPLDAIRNAIE